MKLPVSCIFVFCGFLKWTLSIETEVVKAAGMCLISSVSVGKSIIAKYWCCGVLVCAITLTTVCHDLLLFLASLKFITSQ